MFNRSFFLLKGIAVCNADILYVLLTYNWLLRECVKNVLNACNQNSNYFWEVYGDYHFT